MIVGIKKKNWKFISTHCALVENALLALLTSIRHFFPTLMGLKVNEGNKLQCKSRKVIRMINPNHNPKSLRNFSR